MKDVINNALLILFVCMCFGGFQLLYRACDAGVRIIEAHAPAASGSVTP